MQDILSCSFASNLSLLLFVPGIKPAKLLKTVVLISADIISSAFSTGEIKEIHLQFIIATQKLSS